MTPGLAPRRAAAQLLAGVTEQHRSLADLIAEFNGPVSGLEPPERARAQSLATTALRHVGRIDRALAQFMKKKPAPWAMQVLRVAAAEMRIDGVAPHAGVDAAVRLVRENAKTRHLSGLVNAVARRVSAMDAESWGALPEGPMPGWLWKLIAAAYGKKVAHAIVAAHAAGPPPVDLTVKRPEEAELWAERLGAEVLPTGSLRLRGPGQISSLPGFADGAWWVQDAAAAMPVRLLGDVAGLRVLDVCAAPGGKTMQLAAAGAAVTALDLSEARMGRVRENLERTGLSAELVKADALDWEPEGRFDAIVVDAPCSATGTIRRHPDLPFVREVGDLAGLIALQSRLLARAWGWLKPGGRLLYATCSLIPAEGEEQMAAFRAAAPDAVRVKPDIAALGGEAGWLGRDGGLRLRPDFWAGRGGMDGFYAALAQKSSQVA